MALPGSTWSHPPGEHTHTHTHTKCAGSDFYAASWRTEKAWSLHNPNYVLRPYSDIFPPAFFRFKAFRFLGVILFPLVRNEPCDRWKIQECHGRVRFRGISKWPPTPFARAAARPRLAATVPPFCPRAVRPTARHLSRLGVIRLRRSARHFRASATYLLTAHSCPHTESSACYLLPTNTFPFRPVSHTTGRTVTHLCI